MSLSMKISVIGCGYLGAVHAASMAELGHDVVGVDVDERKVGLLTQARAPFFEPGLRSCWSARWRRVG
jgi:UDPglucose 6-dehydrogenase